MTLMEKRNEERLKSVVRDWLTNVLAGQEKWLEELRLAHVTLDVAYISMQMHDVENKIGTILWLLAMLRPSDPNTVNQWNMHDAEQKSDAV